METLTALGDSERLCLRTLDVIHPELPRQEGTLVVHLGIVYFGLRDAWTEDPQQAELEVPSMLRVGVA